MLCFYLKFHQFLVNNVGQTLSNQVLFVWSSRSSLDVYRYTDVINWHLFSRFLESAAQDDGWIKSLPCLFAFTFAFTFVYFPFYLFTFTVTFVHFHLYLFLFSFLFVHFHLYLCLLSPFYLFTFTFTFVYFHFYLFTFTFGFVHFHLYDGVFKL